jgi:hypothetical protein
LYSAYSVGLVFSKHGLCRCRVDFERLYCSLPAGVWGPVGCFLCICSLMKLLLLAGYAVLLNRLKPMDVHFASRSGYTTLAC